ncbi:hypothetical protein O181_028572 [Austropuccinia psidii MF-1]|uniref:Uncharacterized protein n=1 Tax=Austropuccinia psidii MF-1 TaxID=1389203 RepID=A0A9Q3CS60_9BASI|nr:hypothetical protein [Austropuccinia psidii MF-1]
MSIAYDLRDVLLPKGNHTFKRAYHQRSKMMAAIFNLLLLGPVSMFICSTDKKNYPICESLVGLQLGKEIIGTNLNNPPQAPQWHYFGILRVRFLEKLGKMGFDGLSGKMNWERCLDLYHMEF